MPSFYETTEKIVISETIVTGSDAKEDVNWRPLFAGRMKEDLSPLTQEKMLKMARYLYFTNPLAHSIVDLKTAFVIGGGLHFEASDKKVQDVLKKFWEDPVSAWEIRLPRRVRDLCIDGELYLPVKVNQATGFTRVGFINPLDISKVNVDPNNVETLRTVTLKPDMSHDATNPLIMKVINYNDRTNRLD